MKRCLIYARVSTKQQTTENQLPPLRKFAKDRGWKVIGERIDHGYSGTTDKRPQLIEVMGLARRREFDILLVYALDRFGRSVKHLVNALDEFRSLGIDFCVLNQNIDTTTPAGKLFFTMISGFAEFEAAIIKERVHAGLVRARAEGKQLGRPRTVQVDPHEVQALRKKYSIRQIAAQLGLARSTVHRVLAGREIA